MDAVYSGEVTNQGEVMSEQKLYRQNVLDGFPNGCLLDLRVRLAVDILKNRAMTAVEALDLTTALLAEAEARGLIDALPEDDGLNAQVRRQAGRIARFNVEQQAAGGRISREEQGVVNLPFGPKAN